MFVPARMLMYFSLYCPEDGGMEMGAPPYSFARKSKLSELRS